MEGALGGNGVVAMYRQKRRPSQSATAPYVFFYRKKGNEWRLVRILLASPIYHRHCRFISTDSLLISFAIFDLIALFPMLS
jgi:hypothetical protein